MSLTYANVLDDSILLFLENFTAFGEFIHTETGGGSDELRLDLDRRQITYLPKLVKRNDVVVPVHLAATVLADSRQAVWAWATPEYGDKPVAKLSSRVADFGREQGIATFAEPRHGLEEALTPEVHAIALAACACRITGMPVGQVIPSGTSQVVMLLDPANFRAPRPSAVTFQELVSNAVRSHLVEDSRRAVQGYAQARGMQYRWDEGFGAITLVFAEGQLRVDFDAQGGIGGFDTSLTGPRPD